jgi:hypothetical protein
MSPKRLSTGIAVVILLAPCFARAQSPPQPSAQQPPPPAVTMPPPAKMPPPAVQPLQAPPVVYQLQMPPPPIAAPAVAMYAYAPSPVQQPAWVGAVSTPRTIVIAPGPISLSLAWVGRQLSGLGKTHVWTIGHTSLSQPQPVAAQPTVYYATMVQAPQPQPQQYSLVQVQPPTVVALPPPPREDVPPPPVVPVPSPQSPPRHPLFGKKG